jgi:hypothetical protein
VDATRRTLRRAGGIEQVSPKTTVRRPGGFRPVASRRPRVLCPEHGLAAFGAGLRPNQRVVVRLHAGRRLQGAHRRMRYAQRRTGCLRCLHSPRTHAH